MSKLWSSPYAAAPMLVCVIIAAGACADTHPGQDASAQHERSAERDATTERDAGLGCAADSFGWFELQGAQLGTEAAPNSPDDGPISLQVIEADGFEVGPVRRVEDLLSGSRPKWLLEIKSRRASLRCRVYATHSEFRARDGRQLHESGFDDLARTLYGSAGVRSGSESVVATSCLDRDETGYLELDNVGEELAEVSVSISSEDGFRRPANCVVARGYEVANDRLSIQFTNEGSEPVEQRMGIAQYVLLDDARLPRAFGILASRNLDPIEPGQTVTLEGPYHYEGSSRHLRTSFLY